MKPHDRALLIANAQWHLSEAERLDQLANDPPAKPAAVADVKDITPEWVEATAGPGLLRQTADTHRRIARRIHDQLAQEATDR